jgi:hypothetical protein
MLAREQCALRQNELCRQERLHDDNNGGTKTIWEEHWAIQKYVT